VALVILAMHSLYVIGSTTILMIGWVVNGIIGTIISPTLVDLSYQVNVKLQTASFALTSFSLGYGIGSFTSEYLASN
jgi:MFS family permease